MKELNINELKEDSKFELLKNLNNSDKKGLSSHNDDENNKFIKSYNQYFINGVNEYFIIDTKNKNARKLSIRIKPELFSYKFNNLSVQIDIKTCIAKKNNALVQLADIIDVFSETKKWFEKAETKEAFVFVK